MTWPAARASTWLKNYADDLAGDAYKSGGDDLLYACAGAAYYAVINGLGYNSKEEFSKFFLIHLGLDQDYLAETLKVIEKQ